MVDHVTTGEAVTNLGSGVYRRRGAALVTDRFGNAVPNGTVISLGLMDSVIAMGNDGVIAEGSVTLTGSGYSTEFQFDDSIIRNSAARGVQANDRVLIMNSGADNKNSFVSSVASSMTLDTLANFNENSTGLIYAVGASLLGASISGLDTQGKDSIGSGTTVNGVADFWVTYPANVNTILTGCFGYGTVSPTIDLTTYSAVDTRYQKEESAQVLVVASATDSSATTVSVGDFCFAAIAPISIVAQPSAVSATSVISIFLEDSANISLPLFPVTVNVAITQKAGGSDFNVTASDPGRTDVSGVAQSTLTITGASIASGDAAVVTYFASDQSVSVTVTMP